MTAARILKILQRATLSQDCSQYCTVYNFDVLRCRMFGTNQNSSPGATEKNDTASKRKTVSRKIMLLSLDDSITVTELENAQRLAKRRKLILVKVDDITRKTEIPLYKLESNLSLLEDKNSIDDIDDTEDKDKQEFKTHIKILYISSKIAQHDLLTKTKNVMKLLKKGYKVKVVIKLDDTKGDQVRSIIENAVKNDGNVQKMPSKKTVSFLMISPLKKDESSTDNKEKISESNTANQSDSV